MSRQHDPLPCESVRAWLEAWTDGELEAELAAALRAHLDGCTSCAAEAELAATISNELRSLPQLDASPGAIRALFDRVRSTPRRRSFAALWRSLRARPLWTSLATAAALLLLVTLVVSRRSLTDPESDRLAIEQATRETRLALAYTGKLTRRAGLRLQQEVVRERVLAYAARGITRRPHSETAGDAVAIEPRGAVIEAPQGGHDV